MQRLRLTHHHLLDAREGLRAAAFHHIGGQCPGAAGKTDQRHLACQLVANGANRIHHVTQLAFRIRDRQLHHILQRGDGFGKARSFALAEGEPEPHGIRNRQNIGKQNGRIQRIATQGLQSDFTGQLRMTTQRHEVARLGADGTIFRQIAARLAHHPDRRHIHRLTQEGPQIAVIEQRFCHGLQLLIPF